MALYHFMKSKDIATGIRDYPSRGPLTFPAAINERANWYQRWNSSKANFMALSKHWLGKKNTDI